MRVIAGEDKVVLRPELGDSLGDVERALAYVKLLISKNWVLYTPPGGGWVSPNGDWVFMAPRGEETNVLVGQLDH